MELKIFPWFVFNALAARTLGAGIERFVPRSFAIVPELAKPITGVAS